MSCYYKQGPSHLTLPGAVWDDNLFGDLSFLQIVLSTPELISSEGNTANVSSVTHLRRSNLSKAYQQTSPWIVTIIQQVVNMVFTLPRLKETVAKWKESSFERCTFANWKIYMFIRNLYCGHLECGIDEW